MDPSHNFFAVLTLIAAPAVLTNASSVLALNTANRFGRVVDRARQLTIDMEQMSPSDVVYVLRRAQLLRLRYRAQYLMKAQSFLYFAIGLFVGAALVAVIGTVFSGIHPVAYWLIGIVGLAVGVVATTSLICACLLIVRETRLALVSLREDIALIDDVTTKTT
jgi:hypothetical protein